MSVGPALLRPRTGHYHSLVPVDLVRKVILNLSRDDIRWVA